MASARIGRIILAVLAGYITNAALVVITELILRVPGKHAPQPLRYFVLDLVSQCLYTIIVAYLACWIAGPGHRGAMLGLISLGLVVGSASLASSWNAEPHWYGIALLTVYPVCVWIGCRLRAR